MSTFQRMIVIPQDEYLSLSSLQNVREPLAQHFYNLEGRYNQEGKESDEYRRMILQSSTMKARKQVKDQMRNSLAASTPKPYQSRANALFQNLENFLRFNDKGEIYSDDGTLVTGSRLEDLIQHAVRDRRRNLVPTGWSEFLDLLIDHNVPKSTLNRDTLDEMEDHVVPTTHIEIKEEPLMELSPLPHKRRKMSDLSSATSSMQKKEDKRNRKRAKKSSPSNTHFLRSYKH